MKRLILGILLLGAIACDDGDLLVTEVNFDDVPLEECGGEGLDTTLFFKISGDQTLILELEEDSGLLQNEETPEDQPRMGTISRTGPNISTYRTFSASISKNYFCGSIPLSEPVVINEFIAQGGTVEVTTVAIFNEPDDDSEEESVVIGYEHTIRLVDFSLVNDNGERITNETVEFGVFTTSI